jgi:hypothetical protein
VQAELNSNLHEQVLLLREQKELAENKLGKSAAEVKKLNAKVRLRWPRRGLGERRQGAGVMVAECKQQRWDRAAGFACAPRTEMAENRSAG